MYVASYLKWPKSSWYVLVYEHETKALEAVQLMHLSDPEIRRLDSGTLKTMTPESVSVLYPEATVDEVADLCGCLTQIMSDYKIGSAPIEEPHVEPAAIQVSNFPASHVVSGLDLPPDF